VKIFGLCLVKNEEDIVGESFTKALRWCDRIFVFDTGSEDRTWETVLELSKKYPGIVPYKKETRAFRDELRGEVFNHYRQCAQQGDWWCRLDADEIYIDDPASFLRNLKKTDQVVYSLSHQYYFTGKELEDYQEDKKGFLGTEAEKRLRHYRCNHSEIRFFRHRSRLVWQGGSWPRHLGLVSRKRIRLKHLQYRSPEQIQKRLETRKVAIEQGYKIFSAYDHETDWHAKVAPHNTLHFDNQTGKFETEETSVPLFLEPPWIRFAKRTMQLLQIWP